ncbi:MAG: SWF/SNF helicase family protein, partial [Victivallales bacterium]|nr:SWF/SNF helicase family protein [Victivallales bacterium]
KLRLAVDYPGLVEGGEGLQGSKLETFMELLKGVMNNGHKVLVFSQFVKFLSVVRDTLDNAGISYQYLDGTMTAKERNAAVESFQGGEVPVFLISLKAGGLGLNLTQADYVIHLDSWWNPAVENQASDRAYRLGQNKPVTIYHLRTTNTIEDKIKALHKRKLDLADQLLANTDTIESTSLEELLTLIRE